MRKKLRTYSGGEHCSSRFHRVFRLSGEHSFEQIGSCDSSCESKRFKYSITGGSCDDFCIGNDTKKGGGWQLDEFRHNIDSSASP